MPSKLARRPSRPAFRRGGIGAKALVRTAANKAASTARASAQRSVKNGAIVGGVAAGLYGYAEKEQWALPTVGGINPSLLYGGVLGILVPMFVKGSVARMAEQVGSGLLDVAAYKLGSGQDVIAGEYDDVAGDW